MWVAPSCLDSWLIEVHHNAPVGHLLKYTIRQIRSELASSRGRPSCWEWTRRTSCMPLSSGHLPIYPFHNRLCTYFQQCFQADWGKSLQEHRCGHSLVLFFSHRVFQIWSQKFLWDKQERTQIQINGMGGIWWSERKGVKTLFGSSRGKHLLVVWLFQSRWKCHILDSKKTPTVLCLAVKNLGANCWWESLFWSLSGEFDKVLGPFFLREYWMILMVAATHWFLLWASECLIEL